MTETTPCSTQNCPEAAAQMLVYSCGCVSPVCDLCVLLVTGWGTSPDTYAECDKHEVDVDLSKTEVEPLSNWRLEPE